MLQQTISAGHRFDAESLIVGGSADTPPGVVGQEIDVASGAPWSGGTGDRCGVWRTVGGCPTRGAGYIQGLGCDGCL